MIPIKKLRTPGIRGFSLFCLVLVIGINTQASAAVIYLDDSRRVESDGGDGAGGSYSNIYYPTSPFADFSHSAQTSSLTSSGFSASGSGSAFSDLGWSSTWSFFDVSFSLTTESTIALSGSLFGEDINLGSGDASIALYSGTALLAENILYNNSVAAYAGIQESLIDYFSTLTAGDYRIVAKADPYFQEAYSSYNLTANFAPTTVPVPAAVWLFSSGLISLVGFAKRRRA